MNIYHNNKLVEKVEPNHIAFQSLTYVIPYSQMIRIGILHYPFIKVEIFAGTLDALTTAFPLDGHISEYELMHSRVTRVETNDEFLEITVEV